MNKISITHLARNLADIVNRVSYRGERFTVVRGKRLVAAVVPVPEGRRLGDLAEILAGVPKLSVDSADAFGETLDDARMALGQTGDGPWPS